MSYLKFYELPGFVNEDLTGITFENTTFTKRIFRRLRGERLIIKVQKLSKKRSDAQNRWLWGVCYVRIAAWHLREFGEKLTPEEIHIYVCMKVLGMVYKVKEMFGEEILVLEGTRTSKMNTVQFMEAKEKIQRFYAPKGCIIPDPTQNSFLSDYE